MKSFDNNLYLKLQTENIQKRISKFDKLYLEFGGKLFDDYHASRVLEGFEPDSKIRVLSKLKKNLEVLIVVNANDIDTAKVRNDTNLNYEDETLRMIDKFTSLGFLVNGVVVTHYANQYSADCFITKLERGGIKGYKHYPIAGYPQNTDLILSDSGFGKNEYIETTKPLVIVTAPGPGSGKLATCLSQLFLDNKKGLKSGYAKYETFPVWNLSLKHPVNLAYEAATADLADINVIDYYHKEAYGIDAVNYNRDIESFPVLKLIFEKIYGESPYNSPTDMGVNMVGFAIKNNQAAEESSKQEIIRRYLDSVYQYKLGKVTQETVDKIMNIMNQLKISVDDRKVVNTACTKAEVKGVPVSALAINKTKIITGKQSDLLTSTSACIINALKSLAKIPDKIPLLSKGIIAPIQNLKIVCFGRRVGRLNVEEVLMALAINATTNATAKEALEQLPKLKGMQMHSSSVISQNEITCLKRLGVQSTMSPVQNSFILR